MNLISLVGVRVSWNMVSIGERASAALREIYQQVEPARIEVFALHEWALAEAVIASALGVADKEGMNRVTEVVLKVGELQGIELEILEFAFSQLKRGKLENAEFKTGMAKAEFQCRVCGHKWVLDKQKLDENVAEAIHFLPEIAHAYLRCPGCESPDFEVVEGRGIWLQTVRGVR